MEISSQSDGEGMQEYPDKSEHPPSSSNSSNRDMLCCSNPECRQGTTKLPGFPHSCAVVVREGPAAEAIASVRRRFASRRSAHHTACKCGHPAVHEQARKYLKLMRLHRAFCLQRIQRQKAAGLPSVPVESGVLLKALLKVVIKGLRTLDGKDRCSVMENKIALDRLKHCGFRSEYKLLHMLHNAKLENQSRTSSDEIAKMFERIHI